MAPKGASEPTGALTRREIIEVLATVMRDEAYPDFRLAPAPQWALRAAAKIIDLHQPALRDHLLAEAAAPYRRLLREWQSRTMGRDGIADLYDRTSALLRREVGEVQAADLSPEPTCANCGHTPGLHRLDGTACYFECRCAEYALLRREVGE